MPKRPATAPAAASVFTPVADAPGRFMRANGYGGPAAARAVRVLCSLLPAVSADAASEEGLEMRTESRRQRRAGTAGGRFGRVGGQVVGAPGRRSVPRRAPAGTRPSVSLVRRRRPQRSRRQRALQAVTGLLSSVGGKTTARVRPSGRAGKAGAGLAALTAAAGVAF